MLGRGDSSDSCPTRAAFLNLGQPLALLEVAVEVALAARVLSLRVVGIRRRCKALSDRVFNPGQPRADAALHDEPGADPHILQTAPH